MKIADFCAQDTGGQSFKLAEAIRLHTEHESHSFRKSSDYINFPVEFQHGKLNKEELKWAKEYMAEVNIIHVHNYLHYKNVWFPTNANAKTIIHQHGRPGTFWKQWAKIDKQFNLYRIVSTLNLLGYVDCNADRWLPAPFNIKMFDKIRAENYKADEIFRIAHSPTNRNYKNTEQLIKIADDLKRKKIPVELVLIEKKTYGECLRIRAGCDATFDQIHLAMGNSGLEGCCFRQVVFVGAPKIVYRRYKNITGGIPFVAVDFKNLKDKIEYYATNRKEADKAKNIAYEYVKNWHNYPVVADRIIKIYEKVLFDDNCLS